MQFMQKKIASTGIGFAPASTNPNKSPDSLCISISRRMYTYKRISTQSFEIHNNKSFILKTQKFATNLYVDFFLQLYADLTVSKKPQMFTLTTRLGATHLVIKLYRILLTLFRLCEN